MTDVKISQYTPVDSLVGTELIEVVQGTASKKAVITDITALVTKTSLGLNNVVNLDTSNPTNITQSSGYRFTTDAEKTSWNNKADGFLTIVAVSTGQTITNTDNQKMYHVSGTFTFNLPTNVTAGFTLSVLKTDSAATTVTFAVPGGTLITKGAGTKLITQYNSTSFYFGGTTTWYAVGGLES